MIHNILLVVLLFNLGAMAEVRFGRELFKNKCVSCHNGQGVASTLDFRNTQRIYFIKDQLIQSIKLNLMPPNQTKSDDDCVGTIKDTNYISEDEKRRIISWLMTINDKSSEVLDVPPQGTFVNEKKISHNKLKTLSINEKNLQFLYKKSNLIESYTAYLVKTNQSDAISVYGMSNNYLENRSIHHATLRFKNSKYGLIFPWIKYQSETKFFPKHVTLNIKKNEDLVLILHQRHNENSLNKKNDLKIDLYYKKEEGNSNFILVSAPNSDMLKLPVFTGTLSYTYENNFKQNLNIKMLTPHMHGYGSEILVEKFSKLSPVNKKCLVHVYGYNHNVITSYQFKEPITFDANDQLKITCKYKNSSKMPIFIGLNLNEEMCSAFVLTSKIL